MSHYDHSQQTNDIHTQVGQNEDTFEISLNHLRKIDQAACATDFQTTIQQGWPKSEVHLQDGKMVVRVPGSRFQQSEYSELPMKVQGPIGALTTYDQDAEVGVEVVFADTEQESPTGVGSDKFRDRITVYAETRASKYRHRVAFFPTTGTGHGKITAGPGTIVPTRRESHVATSFVPFGYKPPTERGSDRDSEEGKKKEDTGSE